MGTFFEELKRRKVYRVAVAYVIAAGGIIQLASAVFPAWQLPDWMLRVVVVLLLAGFPLALILAWAFDITPQGIQTTPAAASSSLSDRPHRRRNIFLLAALGLAISAATGFFLLPHASAHRTEKSIAVLPFENFSEDKENAYFADGIQDDILTNLSKIGDLKVISRTSVMAYRNKPESLQKIGKTLGVSAILEGSVRKIGNRVRINVQLINAENDQHIWAEDYDRELTDVFAIQTDLAQKIARELNAHLSPSEKEQMLRKPTDNGEAYLAFVEGHNLQASLEDIGKLRQAQQLYERAIQLDPKFVLALANLSILHSWVYHSFDPSPAEREAASRYAEQALGLQPDSSEAHLAQGYFLYYGKRDYTGALHELALAQRSLPNDAHAYLVIGAIQRRQGNWKDSTANLEKAVSLNPNDDWPLQNLFFNYQMQRDFAAAERVIDRALTLSPKSFAVWSLKARAAVAARADFSVAEQGLASFQAALAKTPGTVDPGTRAECALAAANVAFLQRQWAKVLEALRDLPKEASATKAHLFIEAHIFEGVAQEKLGQTAAARAAYTQAKELAETAVREAPDEPSRHALLGRALALLGEKEQAIAEGKRATDLLPISADAFEGPGISEALAEICALTADNAKAIELLDDLLTRPSDLTVRVVQLEPAFDGLRNDPAFQAMLAKHEGNT
jgi:TolB-like protein/Flp pilus assembly protein TadD